MSGIVRRLAEPVGEVGSLRRLTRVLMLSSLWPPNVLGGAEGYAAELAEQLRGRGDDVQAVTRGIEGDDVAASAPSWPYRLDDWASQGPARRVAFHGVDQWNPAAVRAVRRAVERFRPDVVHSHSVAGMSAAVLAEPSRLGVPHVHTLHDYWLLCQRSSFVQRDGSPCATRCTGCRAVGAGRRLVASRGFADVVVAPSEAIARHHDELDHVRARVRVVFHPVVPHPPVDRSGPTTFGFIGQLTAVKGVPTLVEAFRRLAVPGARLLVAGRGSVEEVPMPGVEWLGYVGGESKEAFFRDVTCLVVPSEWEEPAPLVINEAKGRGIPVIGAAAGGIPELVPASCRELLFPPGDVEALQRSLARVAADPGRYGVGDDEQGPSWDRHVEEIRAAYADARAAHA